MAREGDLKSGAMSRQQARPRAGAATEPCDGGARVAAKSLLARQIIFRLTFYFTSAIIEKLEQFRKTTEEAMKRGIFALFIALLITAVQAAGQENVFSSHIEYCSCPNLPFVYMVARMNSGEEVILRILGEGNKGDKESVRPIAIRDVLTSRHWFAEEIAEKPYYRKGQDLGIMSTCEFIDKYIRSPEEKEVFKYPGC